MFLGCVHIGNSHNALATLLHLYCVICNFFTICSPAYQLAVYLQLQPVNSQVCKQAKAQLKRIKDQLSYMTANFMLHVKFYLWVYNVKKILSNSTNMHYSIHKNKSSCKQIVFCSTCSVVMRIHTQRPLNHKFQS